MKVFKRPASLPLGVDIGPEAVSIVAADAAGDGFIVRETETLDVPQDEGTPLDLRVAETIRRVLARFRTRERRCVIAAPAAEVATRVFRLPPGMRCHEAERAAALEADTLVDWPSSERLVALDPIPGKSSEMLLSIARNSTLERLVAIARAAGLRAVAVDVPACAWRRAIPDADALLDCSTDRATLVVFGQPIGVTHIFAPRLIDDRLASQVRTAFVDARRDGVADVQRLAILGSRYRFESIEELLRDDGYQIERVCLGSHDSPSWAFAYGLASWSVAPRGLGVE
jgi:Tfp pilus assembly PilM family ATPase